MARLRKPLLVLLGLLAVAGVVAARREVADLEAEALLWAEATDPIES